MSHVSVWCWIQKIEGIRIDVNPNRGIVAIDEMKLKELGISSTYGIDVKTKELLAIRASWQRSILDTDLFLRQVLNALISL